MGCFQSVCCFMLWFLSSYLLYEVDRTGFRREVGKYQIGSFDLTSCSGSANWRQPSVSRFRSSAGLHAFICYNRKLYHTSCFIILTGLLLHVRYVYTLCNSRMCHWGGGDLRVCWVDPNIRCLQKNSANEISGTLYTMKCRVCQKIWPRFDSH